MGAVHQGLDLLSQRHVAIKRLLGLGERQRLRFVREGEALARLRHPGIVAVHGLYAERGDPFLVMDLVEGESLEAALRTRGVFAEHEAVGLAESLARALAYAHAHEVLHRDLKPENVLLAAPDRPILVDFGLAKFTDGESGRLTATGAFAGTLGYAAPEQLSDAGQVDARADVYGLGATLFALLTGTPPGGEGSAVGLALVAAAATGQFPRPRELRPELSRQVDALVMRALARDPSQRYQTMAEFADALEGHLAGAAQRARGTRVLVLRGAGGLVVGLAGGLALWLGLGPESAEPAVPDPGPQQIASASPSASAAAEDPIVASGRSRAALRAALWALQGVEPPLVAARQGEIEQALRESRSSEDPELSLLRGRAFRERAEWAAAIGAYSDAASSESCAARAQLGLGLTWLTRLDELPQETRLEQARAALQAAVSGEFAPGALEQGAGVLAGLTLKLTDRSRGLEIEGSLRQIKRLLELWTDEALLRQELQFALGFALVEASGLALGLARPELFNSAPPPRWSPAFAFPKQRAAGPGRRGLPPSALADLQLLCHVLGGRGGIALRVANLEVEAGLAGSLEQTFASAGEELSAAARERLRARLLQVVAPAGRFLREVDGAQAVPFELHPQERNLLVWIRVPEGGALDLELQGAEADLDLVASLDGPPLRDAPWRSENLTHQEHLHLDAGSSPPLRGGLVQVAITRFRSWPESVRGVLLVHATPPGGARPPRWENAWDCGLEGAPEELRSVFPRYHALCLAGRLDEADRLLRPYQARVPSLAALRCKAALAGLDFHRVEALGRELERLGQAPAIPVRFGLMLAASRLGRLPEGIELGKALVAERPLLLDVAFALARYEAAVGQRDAALRRLEAIAERDPTRSSVRYELLRMRAGGGSAEALEQIVALLGEPPPEMTDVERGSLLSELAERKHPRTRALLEAEMAAHSQPGSMQVLDWALCYDRLGERERATRLLDKLEGVPLGLGARALLPIYRKFIKVPEGEDR